MFEIIFITIALLFTIVSIKVIEWHNISKFGFKSSTPLMFLRKPGFYDICLIVIFISALLISLFLASVPWYLGPISLVFAWLIAGQIGQKKAFNKYRQILSKLIKHTENPEEKTEMKLALTKTDQELREEIMLSSKYDFYF